MGKITKPVSPPLVVLKAAKLFVKEKGINEFTVDDLMNFIINNPHKFTKAERNIFESEIFSEVYDAR